MPLPRVSLRIQSAAEPLLNRAPTSDEFGKALGDLMMLIPRLREQPQPYIDRTVGTLGKVLKGFPDELVFAELNIERNLLWLSVRPVRGIRFRIADAIRREIPQAKLVSSL